MIKIKRFPINITNQTANELSGGLCPMLTNTILASGLASADSVPTTYAIRNAIETRLDDVVEIHNIGNGVKFSETYEYDHTNRLGTLHTKRLKSLSNRITLTDSTSSITISYNGADTIQSAISGIYIQGGNLQCLARLDLSEAIDLYSPALMTLSAEENLTSTSLSGMSNYYQNDLSLGKVFIRTPSISAFNFNGEEISIGIANIDDVDSTYESIGSFYTHDSTAVSANGEWQELQYNGNWIKSSIYLTESVGVFAKIESSATTLTGICDIRLMYDRIKWNSRVIGLQCGDSEYPNILKWDLDSSLYGISDGRAGFVGMTSGSLFGAIGYNGNTYAVGGSPTIQKYTSSNGTNAALIGSDAMSADYMFGQISVVEDNMILMGGRISPSGSATDNIRMFDFSNDTGSTISNSSLTVSRYFGVVGSDRLFAYAFGGYSNLSGDIIEIDKWIEANSTVNAVGVSINSVCSESPVLMSTVNNYYILGGADMQPLSAANNLPYYSVFHKADETLSYHTSLPWRSFGGLAFQNTEYGIFAGGKSYSAGVGTQVNLISKFDYSNNTFSTMPMIMIRSLTQEAGANINS